MSIAIPATIPTYIRRYAVFIALCVSFQAKFNDKTPYTIMFGPDRCGQDSKVSAYMYIFNHCSVSLEMSGSDSSFTLFCLATLHFPTQKSDNWRV